MSLARTLLTKATEATTLEGAKAYVDAALLVLNDAESLTVVLQSHAEGKKIEVIKVARELLGIGLKEAKDFVEAFPKRIERLPADKAKQYARAFEGAGATVSLV